MCYNIQAGKRWDFNLMLYPKKIKRRNFMENKGLLFIRKFIATAMIVVLLLTCAPLGLVPEELTFTSSAIATELKEGFYTYELENGKAVITDVDQTISGNITIPSKLGGYDVVRLDYGAFSYCEQMTSVVIPYS